MKIDTRLKLIVWGLYSILFLMGSYVGLQILHLSWPLSLAVGIISALIYPLINIFSCWIGNKTKNKE